LAFYLLLEVLSAENLDKFSQVLGQPVRFHIRCFTEQLQIDHQEGSNPSAEIADRTGFGNCRNALLAAARAMLLFNSHWWRDLFYFLVGDYRDPETGWGNS